MSVCLRTVDTLVSTATVPMGRVGWPTPLQTMPVNSPEWSARTWVAVTLLRVSARVVMGMRVEHVSARAVPRGARDMDNV